jgi:hypothetical protein
MAGDCGLTSPLLRHLRSARWRTHIMRSLNSCMVRCMAAAAPTIGCQCMKSNRQACKHC